MVDDAVFAARQVEILLYGDFKKRVKVYLLTDSEATLESIASSKQIDRKTLRLAVVDFRKRLTESDITFSQSLLKVYHCQTQSLSVDLFQ